MTRANSVLLTVLAALLLPAAASANLIYDEAASGDLADLAGASPTRTLIEGTNTLMGSVLAGDTDDFIVQAAAGLQIAGGIFSVVGSGNLFYNSNAIPVVGGGIFQGNLLADGTVNIASFGLGLFRVAGNSGEFSWRFDFTVVDPARVPEPGTLALLGLGLAGMALTRRKKKV